MPKAYFKIYIYAIIWGKHNIYYSKIFQYSFVNTAIYDIHGCLPFKTEDHITLFIHLCMFLDLFVFFLSTNVG